ncbi:MAG: rod shape-determining protein MreD [Bryocella sp.]
MAEHSYTSRREMDSYDFHTAVTLLVPLGCLLLQAVIPKFIPKAEFVDLPLIAVIFFSVSRRSPVAGTMTGAVIGLMQDGLTNHPFGVFGIAKAVIGYVAASIGFAIDVDNPLNRLVMNFVLSLMQSGLLWTISRMLLGDATFRMSPGHELIRATATAVVSVPIFFLLDRFRMRD